jgi:predicted homoserine dehydrogenase-like protein
MSVDAALREREAKGEPIRVGVVGAGATGRAIALQLATPVPGMRLVAIANRTPTHGERAFREAGVTEWRHAGSARVQRGWQALPVALAGCTAEVHPACASPALPARFAHDRCLH